LLNSLGEYAPAVGVEMNAVNVKFPTVGSRDLIEALPQDHFPKEVVTVERPEREAGCRSPQAVSEARIVSGSGKKAA
jgi:hypothetical protein